MRRLLVILMLVALPLLAQQPATPQRQQPQIQDLKDQIAECAISSRVAENYIARLEAANAALEKQVAELKAPAKVSEKEK